MIEETRRYGLMLEKVPREARDEFQRLSHQHTYFEIKPGEVGEQVAYSVRMTPKERERAMRVADDPASNLHHIEEVGRATPDFVPGKDATGFLSMDGLSASGLNGRGVSVGVLDNGLSHGADGFFSGRIKASRGYIEHNDGTFTTTDGYTDAQLDHGTSMSSIALPPAGRLVFGAAGDYDWDVMTRLLYWMIDLGVDVVNMSWSGPDPSAIFAAALDSAADRNILLFASRGNEGNRTKRYPACHEEVLAISAFDTRDGQRSAYSSYGDVFAASAGDEVRWITRSGSEASSLAGGGGGGTSAASALATRLATSLLSDGRSKGNAKDYMARTARRTASPLYQGHGILQAGAAVSARKRDRPYRRNASGKYVDKSGNPLEGVLVDRGTGDPLPPGPIYGGRRPGRLVGPGGAPLGKQPDCET